MHQYSENLVYQIDQNKLLKFTEINQNEPMGKVKELIGGVGIG